MSAPPTESPGILTSQTTNEEALAMIRTRIQIRRRAVREMSSRLKLRLEAEEAQLEALATKPHTETENGVFSKAVARRVANTRGLLDSVKLNYQAACDRFAAGQDLTPWDLRLITYSLLNGD